jgi:hypothetical protein
MKKNLKQMVEISTKKMTKSELEDQMQYWYSKYCNCVLRDERELYIKVYTSLKDIYDLWLKESRFPE